MKTILLAALLLLTPLAYAEADTVTAHLTVNAGSATAPGWRDCDVTLPAGSHVGDLLDQAVEDGCILEWSYDSFEGFGRYVTSIDDLPGALATYWAFRVDGEYSGLGIDAVVVDSGSTYTFTYEQWVVQL